MGTTERLRRQNAGTLSPLFDHCSITFVHCAAFNRFFSMTAFR
jgi:hypothetical protein